MQFSEQKRDERVEMRVTHDEREYLQRLAAEHRMTVSSLLRAALDFYLASKATDKPGGSPASRKRGRK